MTFATEITDKIFLRLKDSNEENIQAAARELAIHVTTQNRELSREKFDEFIEVIYSNIQKLVNQSNTMMNGLSGIDSLIDIDYHENGGRKFTKLGTLMKVCIGNGGASTTSIHKTAEVYGRLLANQDDNINVEIIEFELIRTLEWLGDNAQQRFIAVLILTQLAKYAPTIFFSHISTFIESIWAALHDQNNIVREAAAGALRSTLELITSRQNPERWLERLWEDCYNRGFKLNVVEKIHGSLLVLGELLLVPGPFRERQFKEASDRILKYKDHKDKLIRRTVITLLPRLAASNPNSFVLNYRHTCINHLLNSIRKDERGVSVSLIALGEMGLALTSAINPYLEHIIQMIKQCLINRRQGCTEAMKSVSMLAKAVGSHLDPYVSDILDLMFDTGLSVTLTECLTELVVYIPSHLPIIQERLLDLLSIVLSGKPYYHSGTPASFRKKKVNVQPSDSRKSALALHTLGTFDFSSHVLTEFVCESVVPYLDDDLPLIRKEAALTCTKLIIGKGEQPPTRGYAATVVAKVLEKLLNVGIADTDSTIRFTVLSALDSRFDHFLAQPENLRCLFLALNDEVFDIRELAINILGRQTKRNPAYVLPSLRTTLIQLLTELKVGRDNVNKEESALLLSLLVRASHQLVKPYVAPILNALFPKISDNNPRVASCALAALGELVQVGQESIKQHNDKLLPPIIATLQDQSSSTKREFALITLGHLAKSTGYVIDPFVIYPHLLDILLNAIQTEQLPSIRREVLRVIGIIGAIDPYKHKITQLKRRPDKRSGSEQSVLQLADEDDIADGISPSSEDYYPTVAISKMLRILRDSSLSAHHTLVVQATIGSICKSLGPKCIPFLPEIMPPLLHSMKVSETGFRKFLFQQLGILVSITKQHIREYLKVIFERINEFWSPPYLVQIISLVEEISSALKDEFKTYLPDLLPQKLDAIQYPITLSTVEVTIKVLTALERFGTQLNDYIHMVLPAVVRVFETESSPSEVRKLAIETMKGLCNKLNFSDYASRIIHPLARVLHEETHELTLIVMDCLCVLAYQLGSEYCTFIPMIKKVKEKHKINHPRYNTIEKKLENHEALLIEDIGDCLYNPAHATTNDTDSKPLKKIKVNQMNLKRVWDASHKSTKADWSEWLRKFSVELLRESPSPALRSCKNLAQVYHPLARELFNASFYSCWNELFDANQDDLKDSLQTALVNVPPKILQTLLNLAEFMEHDDKPLPISVNMLSELAVKCNALAKALRYKETEFREAPGTAVVAHLIFIYNDLQQHEAAVGILEFSQKYHNIKLNESWYEKLQRWNEALEVYDKKYQENNTDADITLGRMRCQYALGQWENLSQFSKEVWHSTHMEQTRCGVAPLAAAAAWNLGEWDYMEELVSAMDPVQFNGSFYKALLAIHKDRYDDAQLFIATARECVDTSLTALVAESYNRAYDEIVNAQLLSELEEVIEYKQLELQSPRRALIKETWKKRLYGSQANVDTWQRMLSLRAMVCTPNENLDTWLKFVSLCRKSGRFSIAQKVLSNLLETDFNQVPASMRVQHPRVAYAYLKHLWATPGCRTEALKRMRVFVELLDDSDTALQARCSLKLGQWQLAKATSDPVELLEKVIPSVLINFKASTRFDKNWYKAWHMWALTNFMALSIMSTQTKSFSQIREYIFPAIHGFFRSIALAPPGQNLQDTLRLLTLWFDYGMYEDVQISIGDGFTTVSIDNWLQVIPQIIARIHTNITPVRKMIHDLLARIGEIHPQALLYSLTVASKSQSASRKSSATAVLDTLRLHSPLLVEQSQLVAQELIRVAILWPEQWHEALEEASRQYFGDNNVEGMLDTLAPFHQMMEKGPETEQEIAFHSQFGKQLREAYSCCKRFRQNNRTAELDKAWELYYDVFRKINKQLPQSTHLELSQISPKLQNLCVDLAIAMPGTYKANTEVVTIKSFDPTLTVITSKQRPRKLTINGSDGNAYHFLLKGHEDLRQDERVMQLFGLVNTLLDSNLETAKRHLTIQRYSVCPLSPNSGLIGWVPLHDTLHALIRDYRESKKIVLNIEHRLMNNVTTDYESLTLIQKVEVFEHALDLTTGMDLDRILWLKSKNSETWLDRRTNFTRSLAVMSMVGYILGLGDRHPSNLMLHRLTGKILHIDFGDCFEVAMFREKFPEKIPFRLTRMLRNAMEVSGIEGNFRYTCERVMEVMRENKQSLMAVLEAFVHDPLLNWRLLSASPAESTLNRELVETEVSSSVSRSRRFIPELDRGVPEILNARAVEVINRVSAKLTGQDFNTVGNTSDELTVAAQVQRLIEQASDHENLCQCYVGWCPFW